MQTAASVWNDHLRHRRSRHYKSHHSYDENYTSLSQQDNQALHFPVKKSEQLPVGFSPRRVLEGREAVKLIVDLLNTLPERTRLAYVLCRIEGLKRKEVAERLGVSVSAVDKHLMAATELIVDNFEDED
jgi:RNA polymerase sigma factor (sigma-70 family)